MFVRSRRRRAGWVTCGFGAADTAPIMDVQRRVPVSMLPLLARSLGVSIEELIGEQPSAAARKRGPAPKIQQHLEKISALPKPRQRAVMEVIEALLAQQGR